MSRRSPRATDPALGTELTPCDAKLPSLLETTPAMSEAVDLLLQTIRSVDPAFRPEGADTAMLAEIAFRTDGHRTSLFFLGKMAAEAGIPFVLARLRSDRPDDAIHIFLASSSTRAVKIDLALGDDASEALATLRGPFDAGALAAALEESAESAAKVIARAVDLGAFVPHSTRSFRLARWLRLPRPLPAREAHVADRIGSYFLEAYALLEERMDAAYDETSAMLREDAANLEMAATLASDPVVALRCARLLARLASHVGLSNTDEALASALDRRASDLPAAERVDAELDLGDALRRSGKYEEAAARLEKLSALPESPRRSAVHMLLEAHLGRDPVRSEALLLDLFERHFDVLSSREVVRAHTLRAYFSRVNGHIDTASADAEEALRIAKEDGFTRLRLDALDVAGWLAFLRGDLPRARQIVDEAETILEHFATDLARSKVVLFRGFLHALDGRLDEAGSAFREALVVSTRSQVPQREEIALLYLGLFSLARRETNETKRAVARLLELVAKGRTAFTSGELAEALLSAASFLDSEGAERTVLLKGNSKEPAAGRVLPPPDSEAPLLRLVVAFTHLISAISSTSGGSESDLRVAFPTCDALRDTSGDTTYLAFLALLRASLTPSLAKHGLHWSRVPKAALSVSIRADGTSFDATPEGHVDLSTRGSLQRILAAMAAAHASPARRPLSRAELFEAGWPGERLPIKSSRNRVHVALATLRRLGLERAIESQSDGYRLADGVVVDPTP